MGLVGGEEARPGRLVCFITVQAEIFLADGWGGNLSGGLLRSQTLGNLDNPVKIEKSPAP